MRISLVLLALLSLGRVSFSQECVEPLQENVDFPGSDIASLFSPDAKHCQLLCTQHPSCLFFSFLRADWTGDDRVFHCLLKSDPSGRPSAQTPQQGVTSGFSLKLCNPDPRPCLSDVYQNVDFLGADYSALFTADAEECQRACTQDPACQFFTFANGAFAPENIRFRCHLKFSLTAPRIPEVERKAGVISGFSETIQITEFFQPACDGQLFPSTDIPGNDLETLPAASPQHCLALCSVRPRCTYFSYVSNSFRCHLKNNPAELVTQSQEGVTSGIPAHFCNLNNAWLKQALEGVDFQGSDLRNEPMDDADTCQRTCTADPNCLFYTFTTDAFDLPDFRRRCFLKRSITAPAPPQVNKANNVVSGFSLRSCL
ncbi:coagulation factor XI-like [Betta splendens]|uniref:Coagulation factor XI-like n=1 Tax=Betta splendens TaxID=158456 RepID=A0A6P7NTX8_BETSP|nr:coagulation factor XI-like [Betta splendens]